MITLHNTSQILPNKMLQGRRVYPLCMFRHLSFGIGSIHNRRPMSNWMPQGKWQPDQLPLLKPSRPARIVALDATQEENRSCYRTRPCSLSSPMKASGEIMVIPSYSRRDKRSSSRVMMCDARALSAVAITTHGSPEFGGKSQIAVSSGDERDTNDHHGARRRHPATA